MTEFFEPPPPPPPPDPAPPTPPWFGPPEGIRPGIVATELVLAQNLSVVVCLTRIAAYPSGLEFDLLVLAAEHDESLDPLLFGHRHRNLRREPNEIPPELLRFGVEFADGGRATNVGGGHHDSEPPEGPVLHQAGGSGGGRRWQQTYWLWPLPPPGALTFACQWPAAGIPLTRETIDAGPILEASTRAEVIFPPAPAGPQTGAPAVTHHSSPPQVIVHDAGTGPPPAAPPPSAAITLVPAPSAGPADWVIAGVRDFDHTVGSVVPASFERYARVFHPAVRSEATGGVDVRWSEVALANGRQLHPLAEWGSITGSWQLHGQPGLWDAAPSTGSLPPSVATRLAEVLARHTATPSQCWFAVWAGWDGIDADLLSAARFELPGREMLLLGGPIAAAALMHSGGSVNLWWPDDRRWCVGTDIDLMTTYVGAGADCIRDLLEAGALESMPAGVNQHITWDADQINPLPPPP